MNQSIIQSVTVHIDLLQVGWFKLVPWAERWTNASNLCLSEDAYLAVPDSTRKVKVFLEIFERYPDVLEKSILSQQVYVGIHSRGGIPRDFITVQGIPTNIYLLIECRASNSEHEFQHKYDECTLQ